MGLVISVTTPLITLRRSCAITESEELFPIKGYEGIYAITKSGKIWSYPKNNRMGLLHKGRWMKICEARYCGISFPHKKYKQLHRLLAETFIPNPENKSQVNHLNGIKHDNRLENLEWVTPAENMRHASDVLGVTHGCKHEKNVNAKLSKDKIHAIRRMISDGVSQSQIAKIYSVHQSLICKINTRKKWGDVL